MGGHLELEFHIFCRYSIDTSVWISDLFFYLYSSVPYLTIFFPFDLLSILLYVSVPHCELSFLYLLAIYSNVLLVIKYIYNFITKYHLIFSNVLLVMKYVSLLFPRLDIVLFYLIRPHLRNEDSSDWHCTVDLFC